MNRVFAHPESGKVLDEGWVRRQFAAAQERAEVPVFKMHDTRSTFATIMWSAGEAISTLQATLGHADVRTTMGYIVGYHERGDEASQIERAFLLGSNGNGLVPRHPSRNAVHAALRRTASAFRLYEEGRRVN